MTHEVLKGILDKDPSQIAAIGGELYASLPSESPAIQIPKAWIQEYTGGRYWDSFRQRTAIPDRVEKIGGLSKLEKMVEWTTNSMGVTSFSSYDPALRSNTEVFVQSLPWVNRLLTISDYGMTEEFRNKIADTPNASELYSLQQKKKNQMGILSPEDRRRYFSLMREANIYKNSVKKDERKEQVPKGELMKSARERVLGEENQQ